MPCGNRGAQFELIARVLGKRTGIIDLLTCPETP
jgi:hypothetical protein